jgi:hypothetical protein
MHVLWMLRALVCVSSTARGMRAEAAPPEVAFPLSTGRDVLGQAVTTSQGKEVGHVEDVVLDASTSDLLYGVVTSGGVLGVGGTLRALPWGVLQAAAEARAFQIHIEEEQCTQAPHVDRGSWPEMLDRHWVDAMHVYDGTTPSLGNAWGRTMRRSHRAPARSCWPRLSSRGT